MLVEMLTFVLQTVVLLFALSFLVEAVVQVVLGSWLWKGVEENANLRAVVLQLAAAAFGVILALAFGIDLIGKVVSFFDVTPVYPQFAFIVGCVLTGLLFGRGSNWFHDLMTKWQEPEIGAINLSAYVDPVLDELTGEAGDGPPALSQEHQKEPAKRYL
jgi:hypothetical protein